MINLNTQSGILHTASNSNNAVSTHIATTQSRADISPAHAQSLMNNIVNQDPATLLAGGASKQAGYAQALALID